MRSFTKQHLISTVAAAGFTLLALGSGDVDKKSKVDIKAAPVNGPAAAELAPIFELGGKGTDIQREEKEQEIKGKVVEWKGLKVYEVTKSGDKCFKIQTSSTTQAPGTFIKTCPDDEATQTMIKALKTDDLVDVKGSIDGISMRFIQLDPAIVSKAGGGVAPAARPSASASPASSTTP